MQELKQQQSQQVNPPVNQQKSVEVGKAPAIVQSSSTSHTSKDDRLSANIANNTTQFHATHAQIQLLFEHFVSLLLVLNPFTSNELQNLIGVNSVSILSYLLCN